MSTRSSALLFMVLTVVSACAPPTPSSDAGESAPTPTVTPFAEFVAEVQAARYDDYARKPETAVQGESAFEEMRRYLLLRYANADVTDSYWYGGAVYDCLRQAGMGSRSSGPAGAPTTVRPESTDDPAATPRPTGTPADAPSVVCVSGTVPLRRLTLAELTRFPTLRSFLGKDPGGGGAPPIPSP